LLVEVEVELGMALQEQLQMEVVMVLQVQLKAAMEFLEPLELIILVVEVVVPVITK
tara:strand:+ start:501 stop:668 length:168 start_codon:yes stop_codon:yes gene_type:complete